MIQGIIFYLFSAIILLSAFKVITARNSVHAVLFLILAFFNSAGLMILLGAEFLAMILVVVYVGAVAVLFLFVVMMLDVNFQELRSGFVKYLPAGLLVAGLLFFEIALVVGGFVLSDTSLVNVPLSANAFNVTPAIDEIHNTDAIGRVLYTHHFIPFQLAGMILLLAMVGAIVLTHRSRGGVKRQKIMDQVHIKREDVVELVKVKNDQGV